MPPRPSHSAQWTTVEYVPQCSGASSLRADACANAPPSPFLALLWLTVDGDTAAFIGAVHLHPRNTQQAAQQPSLHPTPHQL